MSLQIAESPAYISGCCDPDVHWPHSTAFSTHWPLTDLPQIAKSAAIGFLSIHTQWSQDDAEPVIGLKFAGTCGAFVGRALASQHWCCSFEHPAGDLCALCQSVQQLASCSNGSTGNKQSAGTDLDTVVRHTRHS